jgi:hypothetical protein
MKKMLKRADGSTSQRGLWDNIRAKAAANKKAGKKGKAPSKDILEQEDKINAESKEAKGKKYQLAGFSEVPSIKSVVTYGMDKAGKQQQELNAMKAEDDALKRKAASDTSSGLEKIFTKSEPSTSTQIVAGIRRKTGGKKSSWLEESKELKFGGKKKRMGGKNC